MRRKIAKMKFGAIVMLKKKILRPNRNKNGLL